MRKLSEQMARDDANYEEAQSRLRMSMLCKDCVRPLVYPLSLRIVELATIFCPKNKCEDKSFKTEACPNQFFMSTRQLPRQNPMKL